MERAKSAVILTPQFRVRFGWVINPKKDEKKGTEKYSLTMLIPKSADIGPLVAIVKEVIAKQWPDANRAPIGLNPLSFCEANPIRDGDTVRFTSGDNQNMLKKDLFPEFAGCWVVDCSTHTRPGIVDQNNVKIMTREEIYDGCWAWAKVNAYAYYATPKNPQSKSGVAIGLNVLQKTKDDTPLGNAPMDASKEFAPIPGAAPSAPVAFGSPPAPQGFAPQAPAGVQPTTQKSVFG
jgi:hypothetical protein